MNNGQEPIKTILLVEDDPAISMLESMMIKKFGYNVITALDGEKAINLISNKCSIDLILMDIDLGPGIDGTETAEIILKKCDIPILFLSSHIEPEIVEKTEKITSYGYVVKNTGETVLNASIKMAFKLHQAKKRELEKERSLQLRTNELLSLYKISKSINFTSSEDIMVSSALKSILEIVKPDIAFLFLVKDDKLILKDVQPDNKKSFMDNIPEHLTGICLCGLAAQDKESVFCLNIKDDPRCVLDECKKAGFVSFVALPLFSHKENIGIIGLASETKRDFSEKKEFLESLASEISVSLTNARLFEALQNELKDRKITEEILKESELKYRTLFEGSSQGILIADINTKKFLDANPNMCKMLGYTKKELLKKEVKDIHPDEMVSFILSEFKALASGKKTISTSIPLLKKDKTIFYTDISCSKTTIQGTIYIVGFFTDITERKKSDEILRKNEERYRLIVENINDAYYIHDFKGNILDLNEKTCGMLGYTKKELLKGGLALIDSPENAAKMPERMTELIKNGAIIFEGEHIKKDKTKIKVIINGKIVSTEGNGIAQSFVRDITKQKKIEEELILSEKRYKMISDLSLDYIFKIKTQSEDNIAFEFVSDSFKNITGREMEEVKTLDTWAKIFYPDDLEKSMGFLKKLLSGESGSIECRAYIKNNILRWINITAYPEWDNDHKKVVSIIGAVRDISVQKKSEEDLSQALEEKQSLLNELQHRIKNTLALISSLAGLEADSINNPIVSESLENIRSRIETLSNLYTILYNTGDVKEIRLDEYITTIANSILKAYKPNDKEIKLKFNLIKKIVDVKRASSYGLILNELVTNCLKYAFNEMTNGIIKIELSQKDNTLIMSVSDNGMGLKEGLDNINTEGFGLKLVNALINQLKGIIIYTKSKWNIFKIETPL